MVKAIKVMLIPNNVQKTKLFQYAGASRFAYNWALAREIENYEKGGKFISDAELRKEFTKLRHSDEYAWLLSISNNVTKQAIKDACTAYKNFFKGLQKFPRFKSKKRSMPKFYQDNVKIQFSNTHVKFEGFSSSRKANKQKMNWVRLAEHGRIPTIGELAAGLRVDLDKVPKKYAVLDSDFFPITPYPEHGTSARTTSALSSESTSNTVASITALFVC